MPRKATLRAKNGTYVDQQSGQEKTSYITIGHVIETQSGDTMLKIDAIPVDFDGWVYYGELPQKQVQANVATPQQSQDFEGEDIPF
jgi:hypothetical protein